ncbi:hypothetical protein [Streptomyces albireticuli]|uniref:Uncharacterized protein n=1 Tax=Streptomyces albireticuli TaxID=1940 RepID=A0A2A2DFQ4_9ACTN|nr:hypothetical protein [Streptomyces albireticuli]MCD9194410.1 hypothetical protein [Streptomyces albireticuli]PAU50321.1 hypothetical protein CK936_03140 [Streptomyces albireticuli]
MAEDDGDAPIRWDSTARGGAGGWVTASGGTSRAGPRAGTGRGAPPGPDTGGGGFSVRPRVLLFAVGGALVLAAAVLLVAGFLFSGSTGDAGPADAATGGHTSAGPPASPAAPGGEPSRAPTSPSAPSGAADTQAAALDALLTRSAADREKVTAAVSAVDSCASPASVAAAEEALDAAAIRRDGLVSDLSRLPLDALPDARSAAADLRAAWRHSADADRAFARWAADAAGCSPGDVPRGSAFTRAAGSSELATAAKKEFLRKWTPIATRYGLPARDDTRI